MKSPCYTRSAANVRKTIAELLFQAELLVAKMDPRDFKYSDAEKIHCVLCSPNQHFPKEGWHHLLLLGTYTGFHCDRPDHVELFHSIAPESRFCCKPSYNPHNEYGWRVLHEISFQNESEDYSLAEYFEE